MTIYSIIASSFNGLIALILAVYIFAKIFGQGLIKYSACFIHLSQSGVSTTPCLM